MSLQALKLYAGYVADIHILRDLSVEARSGQLTTIIGANGVGKSTLLKCIIGELRPRSGTILFNGKDITGMRTHQLVGTGIGYVAQRRSVFPQLTVQENLEMGLWSVRGHKQRMTDALDSAYEAVPMLADFRKRRAGELSGGQQRVLEIQRALLTSPEVLLIDEPTVGLDPKMTATIYEHLGRLRTDEKRTILMVDQNVIAGTEVADYIYVVELGSNKLEGTKAEFESRYRESISEWLL